MSAQGGQVADAATVVLLRDRSDRGFELFMVRRHGKSAFMGGAHVFPGGKLDPEDSLPALLARLNTSDPDQLIARLGERGSVETLAGLFVAAIRETFEEAGILLVDRPVNLAGLRAELVKGRSFHQLVIEHNLQLDVESLVPYARWITPAMEPRRYDARFFLARAPSSQTAAHDRIETTEGIWLSPGEALAREAKGEIHLPPPTMRTLQIMDAFESIDALFADARTRRPPTIEPVFTQDGDDAVLAFPGDALHPESTRAFPGPTRLVLKNGRWWAR